MRKTLLLSGVLSAFALTACRSPRPAQPPTAIVKKATVPDVGAIAKAGVGEHLLMSGFAKTKEVLVISMDQVIGEKTILAGTYPKVAHGAEYRNFRALILEKEGAKAPRPASVYLFEKDVGSKKLCVSRTSCADLDYTTKEETDFKAAVSQQTLIYSGRIGNRITLGYREFSNDMARPAFNNDVTYDLDESKILGYKGARIEVLNASNTELTYKVLADFN